MGEKEKVTIMVLKVDLGCHKCYKKVKKVLCKFPQIRDQIYDEKQNQVVIKVVCCSPEKIRDKICCKGGGAIKSIEIKEPEKPKPPPAEKPKEPEKPKPAEKPKEPEKPKTAEKPKEPEKPKQTEKPKEPEKPKPAEKPKEPEKSKPVEKPKEPEKSKPAPPPAEPVKPKDDPPKPAPPPTEPMKPSPPPLQPGPVVPGYPPPVQVNACCMDCYHGHPGGPCYSGYGGGPVPYIQYDGYYGRPVYDSYGGGNRGYCVTRPDCFSEENPSACTIM